MTLAVRNPPRPQAFATHHQQEMARESKAGARRRAAPKLLVVLVLSPADRHEKSKGA